MIWRISVTRCEGRYEVRYLRCDDILSDTRWRSIERINARGEPEDVTYPSRGSSLTVSR